jgi:hypothetical protein
VWVKLHHPANTSDLSNESFCQLSTKIFAMSVTNSPHTAKIYKKTNNSGKSSPSEMKNSRDGDFFKKKEKFQENIE